MVQSGLLLFVIAYFMVQPDFIHGYVVLSVDDLYGYILTEDNYDYLKVITNVEIQNEGNNEIAPDRIVCRSGLMEAEGPTYLLAPRSRHAVVRHLVEVYKGQVKLDVLVIANICDGEREKYIISGVDGNNIIYLGILGHCYARTYKISEGEPITKVERSEIQPVECNSRAEEFLNLKNDGKGIVVRLSPPGPEILLESSQRYHEAKTQKGKSSTTITCERLEKVDGQNKKSFVFIASIRILKAPFKGCVVDKYKVSSCEMSVIKSSFPTLKLYSDGTNDYIIYRDEEGKCHKKQYLLFIGEDKPGQITGTFSYKRVYVAVRIARDVPCPFTFSFFGKCI